MTKIEDDEKQDDKQKFVSNSMKMYQQRADLLAAPPSRKDVKLLSEFHTDSAPEWNLKDHPELDGAEVTVVGFSFMPSQTYEAEFIKLTSWVTLPGESKPIPVMLRTFSSFVISALAPSFEAILAGVPVSGFLKKSNRTWLLETSRSE